MSYYEEVICMLIEYVRELMNRLVRGSNGRDRERETERKRESTLVLSREQILVMRILRVGSTGIRMFDSRHVYINMNITGICVCRTNSIAATHCDSHVQM